MLALADGAELGELAVVDEQRHARIAEPERSEPTKLFTKTEAELPARDDRIDRNLRLQVFVGEKRVGMCAEGEGELVDVLGADRESGCSAMPPEPLEVPRAGGERTVKVERT